MPAKQRRAVRYAGGCFTINTNAAGNNIKLAAGDHSERKPKTSTHNEH
ncbi:hypothetical protein [Marinobacter sp.]